MSQSRISRTGLALLLFLTLLNVLNFADRTLLTNLAKQITEEPDLKITYQRIGFLTGYGFIIFYTLIGVGMGTLADRWHRPRLIAMGLAVWSALTAATGLARNFGQIALCRAFIGVGEAALTPAALSILSDKFAPRLRAFTSGAYYAGIPLGAGMGMIVSGYLLPSYGWRGCFVILGVAGLVLVLPLLFLRDPRRGSRETVEGAVSDAVSDAVMDTKASPGLSVIFADFFYTLRRSPALICTILGASLVVYAQSSSAFVLTWLQNERGLSFEYAAKMGGWIYLIGGTLGSVCGGVLGDWFHRLFRSGAGRLWFLVIVKLLFTPLVVLFFTGDVNAAYFKPLWLATSFGSMVWYGAVFSTVQELSPARSRATSVAFLIFCVNMLGAGPGPLITGRIGGSEIDEPFTRALLLSVAVGFLAVPFFVIAAWRYKKDVRLVTETKDAR